MQRAVFRGGQNETDEVIPKESATRFKAETSRLGGSCYEKTREAMVTPFRADGTVYKCDGKVENCNKLRTDGGTAKCLCNRSGTEKSKCPRKRNQRLVRVLKGYNCEYSMKIPELLASLAFMPRILPLLSGE